MKIIQLISLLFIVVVFANAESKYIASGDVILRADPPAPPFYRKAEKIDEIKHGETIILLEKKKVFYYEWMKIKKSNGIVGWVYNGQYEGEPYFKKLEEN